MLEKITFSPEGWESWGLDREPLIRDGMPVLIDQDLKYEEEGRRRPSVVVNRWLRELPLSGAPAERTWHIYADVLRSWMGFLQSRQVDLFGDRQELRGALSAYAGHRLSGPAEARLSPSTWNLHMSVLSGFYKWAVAEDHATAVPFTYAMGVRLADGVVKEVERNLAKVRAPKPHTTIKYLEADFADLFIKALAGLRPDGTSDDSYRGRQVGRNAAMADLVKDSGLRRREFTYLLVYEVPRMPRHRTAVPVPFLVGHSVGKGAKQRTTWMTYDPLERVHEYIEMERLEACEGSSWMPAGEPLFVENPDWEGGTISGRRRLWRTLTVPERMRLVAPRGGSCLLAVQSTGAPFVDWATVFRRTSERIRADYEPRFPIVNCHRLRHTFAMATLELLTKGFYQQAAALVKDTGGDAALALYLTKTDPLLVLRDLLGHSSVTTTELYIKRLDVARIYREAYLDSGRAAGLIKAAAAAEVEAEFDDDSDGEDYDNQEAAL